MAETLALFDPSTIPSFEHHARMAEAWKHKRFRAEFLIETVRMFVIPMGLCQRGPVVDVGSGIGLRVAALRKLGIEAYGIDLAELVVGKLTPLEARQYSFVGNILDSDTFKALRPYYCISDDVLEHLKEGDIARFLEAAKEAGVGEMVHSTTTLEHSRDIHNDPSHITKRYAAQWRYLLNSHGWKVVGSNEKLGRHGVFHMVRA